MRADSGEDFLNFLQKVATADVEGLIRAQKSYGQSWKQRGGVGAFMMLARKWDRLEMCVKKEPKARVGGGGFGTCYDIFAHIIADLRAEGVIDDIRDLRRYLLLVEAEMLARGADLKVARDNKPEEVVFKPSSLRAEPMTVEEAEKIKEDLLGKANFPVPPAPMWGRGRRLTVRDGELLKQEIVDLIENGDKGLHPTLLGRPLAEAVDFLLDHGFTDPPEPEPGVKMETRDWSDFAEDPGADLYAELATVLGVTREQAKHSAILAAHGMGVKPPGEHETASDDYNAFLRRHLNIQTDQMRRATGSPDPIPVGGKKAPFGAGDPLKPKD